MLKRCLCLVGLIAIVGCVESPETATSSNGPSVEDDAAHDAAHDAAQDADQPDMEPDLSACVCDEPGEGQILIGCEDGCEYACDQGFNQCPDEQLVCVPDDVDDPSNGTDDNCDGVVGIVDDAVFVSVGELADDDNDGLTGLSPVQTLGRAVEVLEAEGRTRLILQRGDYNGNLVVDSSFQIEGGWTIDNGIWSPAQGTRSTITGDDADRPTLTISLDQPIESVTLSNIELEGADTELPGQSVFTLFIRGVQDAEHLTVENVRVVGGTAGDGEDGADGALGEDGKNGATGGGESTNAQVTPGGEGGAAPSCAAVDFMKGGNGGESNRNSNNAQTGRVGQDGESDGATGGGGGEGGCNRLEFVLDPCLSGGRIGDSGDRGQRGAGGARGIQSNLSSSINLSGEFPVFVPKTLQSGENGKPGGGGGGGGGGGSVQDTTAPSGGGGGSGGCGGGGGAAGLQGGASVAILVQDSRVDLSTVEVEMGQAGKGGAGGDGAAGGCGGDGGGVISPSSDGVSPGPAGSGGAGGPGGNGAGGDGAPGGPSYGVYVVGQSITGPETISESNPAQRGEPGEAGVSMNNCGQAEADAGQEGDDGAVEKIFSRSE